jgi:nitrile hydratase accessory protein
MKAPLHPALVAGPAAPPRQNGELVFAAPWEGRAFGMAVAMVERLDLDWRDFQGRLIAAIAAEPDRPYYASWVAALEALLVDHGVVAPGDVAAACGRVDAG